MWPFKKHEHSWTIDTEAWILRSDVESTVTTRHSIGVELRTCACGAAQYRDRRCVVRYARNDVWKDCARKLLIGETVLSER